VAIVVPLSATSVTVIPLPPLTSTVTGEIKLIPDNVTATGAEELPEFGVIDNRAGAALLMVNGFVADVPSDVETEIFRVPGAAAAKMVKVAVMLVGLTYWVLLTVMPAPALITRPDETKLVPIRVRFTG